MDDDIIIKQFEAVEQKVEKLLDHLKTLETANSELKEKITTLERELQSKVAKEESYVKERDLVRSRIDMLLNRLDDASDA